MLSGDVKLDRIAIAERRLSPEARLFAQTSFAARD
jgi:hypothetical protein